jgi:hypothetical protein
MCLTLPFLLILLTGQANGQEPSFEARHIERTASFQLEGAPAEVMKLLEPQGRPQWVKNWKFVFLFPPSGDARPGAVIRQIHRSGAVEQIWLLSEYDPPTRIKYIIFVAGMETCERNLEVLQQEVRLDIAGETQKANSFVPDSL